MKVPEITVDAKGYYQPLVRWQANGRRYHMWLEESGDPADGILHSNPLTPPNPFVVGQKSQHRALKQNAKKWAPIVAAIIAKIKAEGLVAAALAKATSEVEAAEQASMQKATAERLARLDSASAALPPRFRRMLLELPDADRLAFAIAIEKAWR